MTHTLSLRVAGLLLDTCEYLTVAGMLPKPHVSFGVGGTAVAIASHHPATERKGSFDHPVISVLLEGRMVKPGMVAVAWSDNRSAPRDVRLDELHKLQTTITEMLREWDGAPLPGTYPLEAGWCSECGFEHYVIHFNMGYYSFTHHMDPSTRQVCPGSGIAA